MKAPVIRPRPKPAAASLVVSGWFLEIEKPKPGPKGAAATPPSPVDTNKLFIDSRFRESVRRVSLADVVVTKTERMASFFGKVLRLMYLLDGANSVPFFMLSKDAEAMEKIHGASLQHV
jgi:hypothetical protein